MEKIMSSDQLPPESHTTTTCCCDICFGEFQERYTLILDCGCTWCADCVKDSIKFAQKKKIECSHGKYYDILSFVEKARDIITEDTFDYAKQKIAELNDACQCSNRKCLRFIDGEFVDDPVATCPSCSEKTCINCKNKAHEGKCDYTLDEDLLEALEVAEEFAATCPECKKLWDRTDDGCHHLVCTCGQDFCFMCSKPWDECRGQCDGGVAEMMTREAANATKEELKNLFDEIRKEVEQEMDIQSKLLLPENELEELEQDSQMLFAEIERAQQENLTYGVYADSLEKADKFVRPLQEKREAARQEDAKRKQHEARKRARAGDDEPGRLSQIRKISSKKDEKSTEDDLDADLLARWGGGDIEEEEEETKKDNKQDDESDTDGKFDKEDSDDDSLFGEGKPRKDENGYFGYGEDEDEGGNPYEFKTGCAEDAVLENDW